MAADQSAAKIEERLAYLELGVREPASRASSAARHRRGRRMDNR
jgi:hypothetical protein